LQFDKFYSQNIYKYTSVAATVAALPFALTPEDSVTAWRHAAMKAWSHERTASRRHGAVPPPRPDAAMA